MITRRHPIKRQSSKKRSTNKKLLAVKDEIEAEAISNNEYYCKGCGNTAAGLDKSHLVPVGVNKALELVKRNMQLLCRICHNKWESGDIVQMVSLHCFAENLREIETLDEDYFIVIERKIATALETLYNLWQQNGSTPAKELYEDLTEADRKH